MPNAYFTCRRVCRTLFRKSPPDMAGFPVACRQKGGARRESLLTADDAMGKTYLFICFYLRCSDVPPEVDSFVKSFVTSAPSLLLHHTRRSSRRALRIGNEMNKLLPFLQKRVTAHVCLPSTLTPRIFTASCLETSLSALDAGQRPQIENNGLIWLSDCRCPLCPALLVAKHTPRRTHVNCSVCPLQLWCNQEKNSWGFWPDDGAREFAGDQGGKVCNEFHSTKMFILMRLNLSDESDEPSHFPSNLTWEFRMTT